MKITICVDCGSDDIQQQASIMVPVNKEIGHSDAGDYFFDDFYYCVKCQDECRVESKEEKKERD